MLKVEQQTLKRSISWQNNDNNSLFSKMLLKQIKRLLKGMKTNTSGRTLGRVLKLYKVFLLLDYVIYRYI